MRVKRGDTDLRSLRSRLTQGSVGKSDGFEDRFSCDGLGDVFYRDMACDPRRPKLVQDIEFADHTVVVERRCQVAHFILDGETTEMHRFLVQRREDDSVGIAVHNTSRGM